MMLSKLILSLVLSCWLALVSSNAAASVLSDAATGLAVGQWTTITPTITGTIATSNWTVYQDSCTWSATSLKMLCIGSYHATGYRFAIYDAATNTWSAGTDITGLPAATTFVGHAYDNNALDRSTNTFYYRIRPATICSNGGPCSLAQFWAYNVTAGTWSSLPDISVGVDPDIATDIEQAGTGMAYFPAVGLLWLTASGKIYKYASGSWTAWVTLSPWTGSTWSAIEYNSTSNTVIAVSPSGQAYEINSSGTATAKSNFPAIGDHYHVTADPVSAKFIVTLANYPSATTTYVYDPSAETATLLSTQPTANILYSVAVPISTYGVIAYMECDAGNVSACGGPIHLYKHTSSISATSDFATRCAAAGVVYCNGMNTMGSYGSADLVTLATDSTNGNIWPQEVTGIYLATVDTSVKRSGAGSLKFTAAAGESNARIAGQYLCCGSTGAWPGSEQFGPGDTLHIQYAMRISPEVFTNAVNYWQDTIKFSIFHMEGASCETKEITIGIYGSTGYNKVAANGECGQKAFYTNGSDISTWWDINTGTGSPTYYIQQGDYPCRYLAIGTCLTIPSDTWFTIYTKATFSTWGSSGHRIEIWYAQDGGAYQKFVDVVNGLSLGCNTPPAPCASEYFNNVSLPGMFMSGGATGPAPVDAYVWYDELIISTQPIAAPAVAADGGSGITPPTAPSNLIVRQAPA